MRMSASINLLSGENGLPGSRWYAPNYEPYPADDDESMGWIFDREPEHLPQSDYLDRYRNRSLDVTSRQNAISYILMKGKGWPVHLLAVACLSLAAKMEEPEVPNLVDLQIGEPRYIFEARTIQRMELLVMAKLKWRLWPVTPFSFISHFVKKLDTSSALSSNRLYSKAVQLILGANRVIDFLGYRPSCIAAAAVLCAAADDRSRVSKYPPEFYSRMQGELRGCVRLMQGMAVEEPWFPSTAMASPPRSPIGVLEAAECTSYNDTHQSSTNGEDQIAIPGGETS
ncbi:cyclin-D4-1-like isoform X2 [Nymphaea colorata]|uniref:cyclin-D4-1-like isoform X2 n=1 Tax=Nymphaea colorata TaxID=210225 RepID=UPI00129EA11A|nr:cyclin-D4-1-like isoform X2 [Nymphaea colorata]